ncbi:SRPBCC family protein [Nonomuraea wenchangensis]|uniref:SRPBCC family protein n=1 Tax=Nonomuraea wenchangensis TaxID=568860 RepID=UPI003426128C
MSLYVEAPPEAVYDLVSDVTRTPEFSPEILRCTWLDGATGPAVGARFEAVNKVRRGSAWKNRPVVVEARPGREFAFSRTEKFAGTLVWRYRLEPDGPGTRLEESYDVTEPLTRIGWSSSARCSAATTAAPSCGRACGRPWSGSERRPRQE